MGQGFRNRSGGIRGLFRLLEEHGEAIEYDLIALGLRLDWLGTEALTWRDLCVIVKQSPIGSALARSYRGHSWTVGDIIALRSLDALRGLSWQTGGGKGPRPKPLPGPEKQAGDVTTGAGRGITVEEANRRLGWN